MTKWDHLVITWSLGLVAWVLLPKEVVMHRHGYVGRKLGRKRDERLTLVKNMATSLVLDESVTTTVPKAKELVPYAERLISKAKKGGLHNRRQIMSALLREDAANKLMDDIAPQLMRTSGFLRLKRAISFRHGDNAELATVSFVDDLSAAMKSQPTVKPTVKVSTKPAVTKTKTKTKTPARTSRTRKVAAGKKEST